MFERRNQVRRCVCGAVVVGPAFSGARVALGLLSVWFAYVLLQQIPLPLGMVQWLSPESRASQPVVFSVKSNLL